MGAEPRWSVSPARFQRKKVASVNSTNPGGGMPGGFMSLSANEDKFGTALLWALIPYGDANAQITPGRLPLLRPGKFRRRPPEYGGQQLKVLWDSQQWNITYNHPKFNVPVVSGGKVFVPTYDGRIDVYGLAGT